MISRSKLNGLQRVEAQVLRGCFGLPQCSTINARNFCKVKAISPVILIVSLGSCVSRYPDAARGASARSEMSAPLSCHTQLSAENCQAYPGNVLVLYALIALSSERRINSAGKHCLLAQGFRAEDRVRPRRVCHTEKLYPCWNQPYLLLQRTQCSSSHDWTLLIQINFLKHQPIDTRHNTWASGNAASRPLRRCLDFSLTLASINGPCRTKND